MYHLAFPNSSRHRVKPDAIADGEIAFVPIAMLLPGDPYLALNPPNPEGGFSSQEQVHDDIA